VLQRIAFKHYGDTPFKDFAFLSTSAVGKREALAQHLASMDDAALKDIGVRAKVLNNSAAKKMAEEENEEDEATPSRAFLLEVCLRECVQGCANIFKKENYHLLNLRNFVYLVLSLLLLRFLFVSFQSLHLYSCHPSHFPPSRLPHSFCPPSGVVERVW
jgi:hypothetical protein